LDYPARADRSSVGFLNFPVKLLVVVGKVKMSLWESVILGIIQGITEFLPISSTAHMLILPRLFRITIPGVGYSVFLHFGTWLALIIFFRQELGEIFFSFIRRAKLPPEVNPGQGNQSRRLVKLILVACIPTAFIGLVFKEFLESFFNNLTAIAFFLIAGGVIMFYGEEKFVPPGKELPQMSFRDALFVGFLQGGAIIPGISRSGVTIAGGLRRGLTRELSFRYAFLLAIPTILGATGVKIYDFFSGREPLEWKTTVIGMFTAALFGYLSIIFLLNYIRRRKLYLFAGYCIILGIGMLLQIYFIGRG